MIRQLRAALTSTELTPNAIVILVAGVLEGLLAFSTVIFKFDPDMCCFQYKIWFAAIVLGLLIKRFNAPRWYLKFFASYIALSWLALQIITNFMQNDELQDFAFSVTGAGAFWLLMLYYLYFFINRWNR